MREHQRCTKLLGQFQTVYPHALMHCDVKDFFSPSIFSGFNLLKNIWLYLEKNTCTRHAHKLRTTDRKLYCDLSVHIISENIENLYSPFGAYIIKTNKIWKKQLNWISARFCYTSYTIIFRRHYTCQQIYWPSDVTSATLHFSTSPWRISQTLYSTAVSLTNLITTDVFHAQSFFLILHALKH